MIQTSGPPALPRRENIGKGSRRSAWLMGWSRRLRIFGKRCELLIRSRSKLLARAKMRTAPRKIEDAPEKDEIQNLWTGKLIRARLRRWLGKRNGCWFVNPRRSLAGINSPVQ